MMLVLGMSGGFDLVHEEGFHSTHPMLWYGMMHSHDSAAVLIEDGRVVAAIEEERLNRIKHTNKMPLGAMRFCLEEGGARIEDVDAFAFYGAEEFCASWLVGRTMAPGFRRPDSLQPGPDFVVGFRDIFQRRIEREFGARVDPSRLCFVQHHVAHAASAFYPSGFEQSLVMTIDGMGDGESGRVLIGDESSLRTLRVLLPTECGSLGLFYLDVTVFLGFKPFDEYKVMGLAPYGDPSRFHSLFQQFYTLHADGGFTIHRDKMPLLLLSAVPPRKAWDPLGQVHRDLAASLQEALEQIVFHMLRHFRTSTGEKNLCLSGGVAHNCTLNGKIVASNLFERVFVQPASHDAGCALGAALHVAVERGQNARSVIGASRLSHLNWGRSLGESDATNALLHRYEDFVEVVPSEDVCRSAAKLLSDGQVIAWVQGRSEFGPRALGNRSILADPRPADNKDRINAIIKKREGFRPFAPAALVEHAKHYFDLPDGTEAPFMIFTVSVRPDKRALLGAVTHVDGSARLQTVSRRDNRKFWELIDAFRELTGVPILLNTSFNNDAEPIVDSAEDAIISLLTTGLDWLVLGDVLVRKRAGTEHAYSNLVPMLPRHVRLQATWRAGSAHCLERLGHIGNSYDGTTTTLTSPVFDLLVSIDGRRCIEELLDAAECRDASDRDTLITALVTLWSKRLVTLAPRAKR